MEKTEKTGLPLPTIPIEQAQYLLRYLATLSPDVRFDSRVLFQQLGTSAKKTHDDWVQLAAAHYQLMGIDPEAARSSPDEEFLMLTPEQASLLLIYDGIEEKDLDAWNPYQYEVLLQTYHAFQSLCPPSRYAHPWGEEMGWLLSHHLDQAQNRTKEELESPQMVTTEQEEPSEKQIEMAFGKRLEEQGIPVQYQVRCAHGIADIVTPDAIYEIELYLDRHSLFTAIGQVLVYRASINPAARAVVVGRAPKRGPLSIHMAEALGVEVIVWDQL